MFVLDEAQLAQLREDLAVAETHCKFLEAEGGEDIIYPYWMGRRDSLRSIDAVTNFSEDEPDDKKTGV